MTPGRTANRPQNKKQRSQQIFILDLQIAVVALLLEWYSSYASIAECSCYLRYQFKDATGIAQGMILHQRLCSHYILDLCNEAKHSLTHYHAVPLT